MECSRDNLELVTNTFGKDIVVGVECIFTWYWVADFCAERGIDFALGHAYYMKSIHGGKTKSDKIDSEKIANMLRERSLQKYNISEVQRSCDFENGECGSCHVPGLPRYNHKT